MNQQGHMTAQWRGSAKTADAVREEIAKRFGVEEAEQYDPTKNCFTLKTWNKLGYRVKKGAKAIRSITYIEAKDQESKDETDGEEQAVRTYRKTVYLFYKTQVEKR